MPVRHFVLAILVLASLPATPVRAGDQDETPFTVTRDYDFTKVLANEMVGGDPETPIFTALPGQATRYRVLHPGRATLCIRRQADGNWGVSELEASCNRKADPATREFVNAWLEPYRLGV